MHSERETRTTEGQPILDFPRRQSIESAVSCYIKATKSQKGVQFSQTSELLFIEHYDKSGMCYSDLDYKAMQIANEQAIKSAHLRFRSCRVSCEDATDCELAGIEHLLTPHMVKKLRTERIESMRAVLDEQARQCSAGTYDLHAIARAPERHTKSAAKRAYIIGLLRSKWVLSYC